MTPRRSFVSFLFGFLAAVPLILLAWTARDLHASGSRSVDRACLTPEQAEILSLLSLERVDDGAGGTVTTLRVSGANLQVVNGLGSTSTSNGTGNLIVGYNEPSGSRTGSHNILCGTRLDHERHGSILVGRNHALGPAAAWTAILGGENHQISAPHAAIVGGRGNQVAGSCATVTGGYFNIASGDFSSISGGQQGSATGAYASISGGVLGIAAGENSHVCGGDRNRALGCNASILGGLDNEVDTTDGCNGTIAGGQYNVARGGSSTVSGGAYRIVEGFQDWVAGTLLEDE